MSHDLPTLTWLKAAAGALLYVKETGGPPPGLDLLLEGLLFHFQNQGDVPSRLERVVGEMTDGKS